MVTAPGSASRGTRNHQTSTEVECAEALPGYQDGTLRTKRARATVASQPWREMLGRCVQATRVSARGPGTSRSGDAFWRRLRVRWCGTPSSIVDSTAYKLDDAVEVKTASDFAELSPSYRAVRDDLGGLVEQLSLLGTGNTLGQMLRLGEIVHRALRVSGDDSQENAQKASLRRIAAHPDVPFKVTTIWRAVSVYEISLRLPHLLQVEGLGISHFRAVIGLRPSDQEELLSRASREGWTKRQLEREAAGRREGQRRRGRRPTPRAVLWSRELQRLMERSTEVEGSTSDIDGTARAELTSRLEEAEARCRALRERLGKFDTPLD